jgi:ATP-dependent helicase/nuclease subunit B
MSPDDPRFDLTVKPRGLYDARVIHQLDASLEPGGTSQVVNARLKADGQFGYKSSSDFAEPAEFAALLEHVQRKIAQLADGIMSGDIAVAPYWLNQRTPCPACEFRSVCRFETTVNRYHTLNAMKREEVLERVTQGGAEVRAT